MYFLCVQTECHYQECSISSANALKGTQCGIAFDSLRTLASFPDRVEGKWIGIKIGPDSSLVTVAQGGNMIFQTKGAIPFLPAYFLQYIRLYLFS